MEQFQPGMIVKIAKDYPESNVGKRVKLVRRANDTIALHEAFPHKREHFAQNGWVVDPVDDVEMYTDKERSKTAVVRPGELFNNRELIILQEHIVAM